MENNYKDTFLFIELETWVMLIPVILIFLFFKKLKNISSKSKKNISKNSLGYEKVSNVKTGNKKGGLGSFLAGGLVANKITGSSTPPTIIFEDTRYVTMGMKKKVSGWEIKVGEKTSNGRVSQIGNINVNRNSSSGNCGKARYKVYYNK